MLSAGSFSIDSDSLLPGEQATISASVYSDAAVTADVSLTLFGVGSLTLVSSSIPSSSISTTPVMDSTGTVQLGTAYSWSWAFDAPGYASSTFTVQAGQEPAAWNAIAVLQAADQTSTMPVQFLSFQVGPVVTTSGGTAGLRCIDTPPPVSDALPGLYITQLSAPVTAAVGADVTVKAGPSYLVWGKAATNFGSSMSDSASIQTSGAQATLVSGAPAAYPDNPLVQTTWVWTVDGPGVVTVTGGLDMGTETVYGYASALLSLPVGIGLYPTTYPLPTTGSGSGGSTGGGSGSGSGSGSGTGSTAATSWWRRNLWWLIAASVAAAGGGTAIAVHEAHKHGSGTGKHRLQRKQPARRA